jgi:hypothetical protein
LRASSDTAIAAFEVLQKGALESAGSTGALVHRNLSAIRALAVPRQAWPLTVRMPT